jgi:hypothetical protein
MALHCKTKAHYQRSGGKLIGIEQLERSGKFVEVTGIQCKSNYVILIRSLLISFDGSSIIYRIVDFFKSLFICNFLSLLQHMELLKTFSTESIFSVFIKY